MVATKASRARDPAVMSAEAVAIVDNVARTTVAGKAAVATGNVAAVVAEPAAEASPLVAAIRPAVAGESKSCAGRATVEHHLGAVTRRTRKLSRKKPGVGNPSPGSFVLESCAYTPA